MRERQEAKLLRVYNQKAQESRIVIGHHHEEEMDKKQQYVREMKEKMMARLNFQKGRMELEHQERVRDCKIEKGKDLISDKAEIKARYELGFER